VRLQKILAAAGVASRRRAEDLLREGRVTVNGRVSSLGESADPERDVILVDGRPVHPEALEYWLVHKPAGVLTTVHDPFGRRHVVDLLPERRVRLFPVGRLDLDTEGLVLLTNDGALAHRLLHPSHQVEREYQVTVEGRASARELSPLAQGMSLDDGPTAPARVGRPRYEAASDRTRFTLVLIEGRKRQIRRALEKLGHPVVRLVRVRMGPLRLGRLAAGAARRLTPAERRELGTMDD
jgi:23S rRNA pseudouridine2605 synthase